MSEAESRQWREQLGRVMTEYDLQWVLEQVEQHIRFGKTSEKEIQPCSERRPGSMSGAPTDLLPLPPTAAYSSGRKARFLASQEYTENEMLEIIIDAVERGVADTAEMEAEMLKQFEYGGIQYRAVFTSEDSESIPAVAKPGDAVSRAASASRLRDLLKELRAEI
jgi:hypothetical protein